VGYSRDIMRANITHRGRGFEGSCGKLNAPRFEHGGRVPASDNNDANPTHRLRLDPSITRFQSFPSVSSFARCSHFAETRPKERSIIRRRANRRAFRVLTLFLPPVPSVETGPRAPLLPHRIARINYRRRAHWQRSIISRNVPRRALTARLM